MPTLRQSLLAAALRRYPLKSGVGSLANSKLVTRLTGASDERVWCPTRGGEILASLNDYVGRAAFFCGDLDPKISWIARRLINPGDTVCDIGANIGVVTLLLSKLVGPTGQVLAFEPNPNCWEALDAAVRRNRISNVQALPFALGSTSEERQLNVPEYNAGGGSLERRSGLDSDRTLNVSVRTLDEIVAERKIERIDFIKLDVEGFEPHVLKGGLRTLDAIRPAAILFEMNEKSAGTLASNPVFAMLAKQDYAFLSLPKAVFRVRPQMLDINSETQSCSHDVLAIPKGNKLDMAKRRLNVRT